MYDVEEVLHAHRVGVAENEREDEKHGDDVRERVPDTHGVTEWHDVREPVPHTDTVFVGTSEASMDTTGEVEGDMEDVPQRVGDSDIVGVELEQGDTDEDRDEDMVPVLHRDVDGEPVIVSVALPAALLEGLTDAADDFETERLVVAETDEHRVCDVHAERDGVELEHGDTDEDREVERMREDVAQLEWVLDVQDDGDTSRVVGIGLRLTVPHRERDCVAQLVGVELEQGDTDEEREVENVSDCVTDAVPVMLARPVATVRDTVLVTLVRPVATVAVALATRVVGCGVRVGEPHAEADLRRVVGCGVRVGEPHAEADLCSVVALGLRERVPRPVATVRDTVEHLDGSDERDRDKVAVDDLVCASRHGRSSKRSRRSRRDILVSERASRQANRWKGPHYENREGLHGRRSAKLRHYHQMLACINRQLFTETPVETRNANGEEGVVRKGWSTIRGGRQSALACACMLAQNRATRSAPSSAINHPPTKSAPSFPPISATARSPTPLPPAHVGRGAHDARSPLLRSHFTR